MGGRQVITRCRRKTFPSDQVGPCPMSNQRRMGRCGAHGNPCGQRPTLMARPDGAEFASNVHGVERSASGIRLEQHARPRGIQLRMVTLRAKLFQVPFEIVGGIGHSSEIASIRTLDSQCSEIGYALEFGRHCRRTERLLWVELERRRLLKDGQTMTFSIGTVQRLVWIGRDGRPSGLHG